MNMRARVPTFVRVLPLQTLSLLDGDAGDARGRCHTTTPEP
jgi:hypothetical protein